MKNLLYFKSDYQEELFESILKKFRNDDVYYVGFAYVASAIYKKDVLKAVGDHEVDVDKLIKMSDVWSGSERAMLELAFQMFNGGNLYYEDDEEEQPSFTTIESIFRSLDGENTQVAVKAIGLKYSIL